MIWFFYLSIVSAPSTMSMPAESSNSWKLNGRAWTDSIFMMDDFSSQSVIDIYENASCENPGELLKVVFGKEGAATETECSTHCCRERVIRGDETVAERIISNAAETDKSITDAYKTGPSLVSSVGIDAEAGSKRSSIKVHGTFASSVLDERAMLGHDRYRYQFTEAFGQYKTSSYRFRLGRQNPIAGVLTDGIDANFFLGNAGYNESKNIGFFAGLTPNPISKKPDHKRMTVGAYGTYIPEFSSRSDTKLRVDSGLVGELYKQKLNRLYLYNRTHFTPIKTFSLLGTTTIDTLSPSGDDKSFGVNYASLTGFWRPDIRWFASLGYSQFKIDRYLREESVRWLTDENSQQADRLGDTLDRSYRYRVDAKASFKAFYFMTPYIRARYERRSFDSNKTSLNRAAGSTTAAPQNLVLLNKKNAYKVEPGIRIFPIERVETDTNFSVNQRFQSRSYEVYQSVQWEPNKLWALDAYGQGVWSSRLLLNSVATGASQKSKTTDYYVGLGASYKFVTDLVGQIRYDFSCEEDSYLEQSILSHAAWARLDYKF